MNKVKRNRYKVVQVNTVAETFNCFAEGQLSYLKSMGFDVYAICSPGPMFERFTEQEGIKGYSVNMTRKISPFKDILSFIKMVTILARIRPDIIQGSTPKAAFITMLSAKLLKIRVRIFFMRGLRYTGLFGLRRIIVKYMEKISCYCANQIIATSPSVMDAAIKAEICSPRRIKVLFHGTANGIDTNRFSPNRFSLENRKHLCESLKIPYRFNKILFVGRIAKDKGIQELYYAWAKIRTIYNELALILVGRLENEDPVSSNIIDGFQRDPRVFMVGHVAKPDIYYSIADIFVLPSYREGIPISVLEASSMTLPVISTNVTGCIDAIDDNVTGMLVPPKNAERLAEAICIYLNSPILRNRHGYNGRRKVVQEFDRYNIWRMINYEYKSQLLYNMTK